LGVIPTQKEGFFFQIIAQVKKKSTTFAREKGKSSSKVIRLFHFKN
jgi:hypothetical protein